MFCSNCGSKQEEKSKFCSNCGKETNNKVLKASDNIKKESKNHSESKELTNIYGDKIETATGVNFNDTKNCRHCFEEMNINAKVCPHCKRKQKKSKALLIIGLILFLIIVPIIIGLNQTLDETLSADEIAKYKAECEVYDYEDIARNPEKHKGKKAVFYGEVAQVEEMMNSLIIRLNVNQETTGWWDDTIYITYQKRTGFSERILEEDLITVYGVLDGLETYTAILGNSITIPKMEARFIERGEASLETYKVKDEEINLEKIEFEKRLKGGHYIAGIDFPAGKYDIVAVSGSGLVSSSNYENGITEMMASKEDEFYIKEFKNVVLRNNFVLSVSGGLEILISTTEGSADKLKTREQIVEKEYNFTAGNYLSGSDFDPGVYNIIAVSGNGLVSSSNYENGITEMMASKEDEFYIKEFKNVTLNEGTTLEVSGVKVKLVPSQ